MVEAATNLFLETLRDLLVEEAKFLLSVRGEVEKVKGDLETIHAMLMKADRERSDSPTLKLYVKQLKALAFEAETLLETYAVEVESKVTEGRRSLKERLQRYACILGECFTLHEVGRGAGDILSRLADLTKNLESEFGQKSSTRPGDQEDLLRQTYAHEVEPHFVGMEKEIEEIVSMVKDERKRGPRVVKVYGMGGLGKTTLVRKIYNHGDVAPYARAWVCVTQKFEAKAVLGRILKQLDDKARADSMGVSELVEGIHKFLDKRRSLIVIDDIWENNHWDVIKKAFPMGCNVLLTTRSESIGNVECHPYKLDFPTEDQGWDLLKKIALSKDFDAAEMDLKSLENIGKQIVVKCGHLPLSISVIGGILRQKEECLVAEWERVSMNLDSYLMHGEGVEEYKRVKHVLDLSYDALPYYLKPCFLYLACLPEDEEIKTEKLYLLWMAEGFISYEDKGRNESLRDVAERYLSELATRCMVQVHKGETPLDKFETCRLHDLMQELCSLKAEQENLLKLLGLSTYKSTGIPSSDVSFVNRLAIINDSNTDDTLTTDRLQEVKDLRSFIILGKDGHYSPRIHFKDSTAYFEKSKCLRLLVLDRCDIDGEKLPTNVDKLIHLRYLSLHYSRVRELPEFVCSMPYLHTLDLRVWNNDIKMANLLWKMKKLRHLFLPTYIEVIGGEKLRLDGLDELETLDEIVSETARVIDILQLISLRKLCVTVDDLEGIQTVIQYNNNNNNNKNGGRSRETHLDVQSCDFTRKDFRNMLMSPLLVTLRTKKCSIGDGFPRYEQGMSRSLVRLYLSNLEVGGDGMEELGKYPVLRTLTLELVGFGKTETMICRSGSFPQLLSLTLCLLSDLKNCIVEERAMPKLSELEIESCSRLEKVPDGLRFVSGLRQVKVCNMPKRFQERVRGEDSACISHVPFVKIYSY